MEDNSIAGQGKNVLTNICIAFNNIIEASGRWAGVYANRNWYDNYLNKDEIKRRYTTWIATYTDAVNKYKGEYDIWQNSSKGRICGIAHYVDTNYMYRDLITEVKRTTKKEEVQTSTKSINELVNEVIEGLWGDGEDRKNRLRNAGYNYETIQSAVNSKLSKPKMTTVIYTVKKGDTLSKIANKYGTTYKKIADDNGIANPNKIFVGQKIKIIK